MEGKLSPVKGRRVGSRLTLELTSVRRWAVMSLMRSWRLDKAPFKEAKSVVNSEWFEDHAMHMEQV